MGKRIVFELDGGHFISLHLMVAGRLRFGPPQAPLPKKVGLAGLDFSSGTLIITEAGSKRRAAMHVLDSEVALKQLDPKGLEVLDSTLSTFTQAVTATNHTLKRALTDPRILSGIGNAYSDEILHDAMLSPVQLSQRLNADQLTRLWNSCRHVLRQATARLAAETGSSFPKHVTAFRPEMAVHGKFKAPCPRCGAAVQRIAYANNETNYCPTCQTGGKLLADRALSKLLRRDWPRTATELDERLGRTPSSDEPAG